jgi:hypothetical protein
MRALMKVNNPRLTRQAFERTQTMEEINGQGGAQKVRRTRSWQPPSKKGSKYTSLEFTYTHILENF